MPKILEFILEQLQSQTIISPFVIIHGPWVDAQRQNVRESCQTAAWFFAYQDVLEIKDYSTLLGKPHSLKVEYKKSTDTDLLQKEEWYEDIWSREINERLSMAPAGDTKTLLIEHIDRATIGGANALLKSLEEPLPHRLIIASVRNKDTLLPTILSRALLIHCDAAYTPEWLTWEQKELFDSILIALQEKNIAVLTKWATQIGKWGWGREFLDNLLASYANKNRFDSIASVIQARRQIVSNVSVEHTIFSLLLNLLH